MHVWDSVKKTMVVLFCLVGFSFAANYYVSPTGNDNFAGTVASPFATIAKARDAVRSANVNMSADNTIYLRGGWYVLSSALTFTQSDGGTNNHNVIYQAYPGEYPVISGGRQITGWTLHDASKNIWKATATGLNCRQLYVNCVRAIRAHKGMGWGMSVRTYGYKTSDTTLQRLKNHSDIELIFNGAGVNGGASSGNYQWTEHRCGVQSISDTMVTMKQPGWGYVIGNQGYGVKASPTDVENVFEYLDTPGEWYLDRTAGIVYYIPRFGEDMATAMVIVPVLQTIMSATGAIGTPVQNMQFKGITFAHATYMRASSNDGWPETQANYLSAGSVRRTPGNVVVQAGWNFRFERCVFKHLGGAGLDVYGGSQNNTIIGCVFTDISANCIQLGNTNDPTRSDTRARDLNNQVLNCYIHDAPSEYHSGCGIMCAYVTNTLISHNDISYTPYTGVSMGWGWSASNSCMANNITSYNHIYHSLISLGDGGNFYSLSPQPNSKVLNNYLHDNHHVQGTIYLDNGTQHYEVARNVCTKVTLNWVTMNNDHSDISDINLHDNITDDPAARIDATQLTNLNNTLVLNGLWPAAAQPIIDSAGIETDWRDVFSLPCGCSISRHDTASQPSIVNGYVKDPSHIVVFFDRAMDLTTAQNNANYSVNSGVTISSIVKGNNGSEFILTTSSLSESDVYTLAINNVRGSGPQGKTISANSTVQVTGLGNGLIGWWKLDETTGTIAHDASGYNHDGVLLNDTSLVWKTGKIGNGLQFKGTSSTVTIPATAMAPISATGDMTIAMWANPVFIDYYLNVFTSSNTILRYTIKKQQFQVTIGQGSTLTDYLPGYEYSDYGVWQYIALVKRNGTAYLYRNGALKATWTAGAMSNQSIVLGGLTGGGALAYKGLIDDVRLYNRALSSNEMLSLAQGVSGPNVVGVERRRPSLLKKQTRALEISVFNCKGERVENYNAIKDCSVRPKTALARGVYVVTIKSANAVAVEKIMVVGNNALSIAEMVR